MMKLTLDLIEQRINDHKPLHQTIGSDTRQAGVATVLRKRQHHIEALFILRAVREGDPWSGQMAFPGGHRDLGDASLRAAAERETQEEVGLNLGADARFLGELDQVRVNPRGRDLDMVVSPFVYLLEGTEPHVASHDEIADILWGSLDDMYLRHSLTTAEFVIGGETVTYPGYTVSEHMVWGLTLNMLDQFFSVLDPDWEHVYKWYAS